MLNVPYEPNELLLKSDEPEVSTSVDAITTIPLIDFNSQPVATPPMPPSVPPNFNANSNIVRPIGFDLPSPPTHSPLDSPMHTQKSQQAPKDDSKLKKLANELNRLVPQAPSTSMDRSPPPNYDSIVSAPSASSVGQSAGAGSSAAGDQDDNEEIDFDDLARRFEALKRAK